MYSSIESIMAMFERENYTRPDINQALSDLETMCRAGSISDYQYKNVKALLEAKKGAFFRSPGTCYWGSTPAI